MSNPPSPSSSTTPATSNTSSMTDEQRKEAFTQCLLSQFKFCAGGVVLGGSYSIARASKVRVGPWPMLGGGFAGTMGDFIYGYFVECAHLRDGGSNAAIVGRISGDEK